MDNTFDKVNQGDLVIRKGKHEADIRFVEGITKEVQVNTEVFPDDQVHILLVNGNKDLSYDGENGIKRFNADWRLLVKKENLIEDKYKKRLFP